MKRREKPKQRRKLDKEASEQKTNLHNNIVAIQENYRISEDIFLESFYGERFEYQGLLDKM